MMPQPSWRGSKASYISNHGIELTERSHFESKSNYILRGSTDRLESISFGVVFSHISFHSFPGTESDYILRNGVLART